MLSAPAWGFTSAKLDVNTEELKGQADQVVEVNLDGIALLEGSKLLAIREGISGSVKSVLSGIKGSYRKTYRFAAGNSYEEGAVTSIRSQMTDGGWAPMIDVQDKKQNKGLTVYSYTSKDGTSNGVTVISTDPGEITVLNLVGDIDLDALAEVGATLGMPAMSVATTDLVKPKTPLPPAPKK
jgi:hypothetical protein